MDQPNGSSSIRWMTSRISSSLLAIYASAYTAVSAVVNAVTFYAEDFDPPPALEDSNFFRRLSELFRQGVFFFCSACINCVQEQDK